MQIDQTDTRYIIYCDESDGKGTYFSHFYGGVLIDARNRDQIEKDLREAYQRLNIQGEVKWTKIGAGHEQRYKSIIDVFFDFVEAGDIKVRIMFLQNMFSASDLEDYHIDNQYFILYYHFIKHAFGLQFCNPDNNGVVQLQLLFDEFPDKRERCEEFKNYLSSLSHFPLFSRHRVRISRDDIGEMDGKQHMIAQCLDVVLGAMQFRLNDKHLEKPLGATRRGKRTIAKEKVYKHIQRRIQGIYPNFNIGISTGQPDVNSRWSHRYRHWKFVPTNARVDMQYKKPK